MRFGTLLSLRTLFDPYTVVVWCEVLPAGVKRGVIWLVAREPGATPDRERDSAHPHGIDSLVVLPSLIWLQEIDDWRNTRPVLEGLGQMRRLDRRLFGELGNALGDGEHACNLFGRQLELPDRRREQTLVGSIQRVGRS